MSLDDNPYLSDYLYNKHLPIFGELFRKICNTANLSQDKLADLSKQEYGRLQDLDILSAPGANIGSLIQTAISRAQLGEFRPTPQQVLFWIEILKQRLEDLGLELDPQVRKACYTLALGGPLEEVEQAVKLARKIVHAQQTAIAKPLEKNTDIDIPSAHSLEHKEPNSYMRIENVDEVRAAILKIKEQESQR